MKKLGKILLPPIGYGKKKNESLTEKLVEAPQEVVDALLGILEEYGFILDDEFKGNNPGKTWMGNVHIQVINPDSYIDIEDEEICLLFNESFPDFFIDSLLVEFSCLLFLLFCLFLR